MTDSRLSDVQRRVHPDARGIPWLKWWMNCKVHPVTTREMEAWLIQIDVDKKAIKKGEVRS